MQNKNRFSIGEIAKLTGVTIRTVQYYDNVGILPLEKESTNGRRYYRESDLARLQQILFYKSLGLKINDIKNILEETATEQQLIFVLEKQRDILYRKLNDLRSNIAYVEMSLESLKVNKSLPLGNLIQLIISLNKETIFEYEKVKYDKNIQQTFKKHYKDDESIFGIYWDWKSLILEAVSHILNGIEPESYQGQIFAKKWVDMTVKITNGDKDLLEAYKISYENRDQWPDEDLKLMEFTNDFIDRATEIYLTDDDEKNLEEQ